MIQEDMTAIPRDLKEKIIQKARQDEIFKNQLLTNPHNAITRFGAHISKKVEVKVMEESARVAYLVLPVLQEEMTDEELDMVAGGICFIYS
ncbi:NHLP leader peptide domain-containing protein [Desulfotomaculum arcticum]|uniref:NHLP leader peptide domain-containing protein n=1 Tax=Desulfotruncus arcticus DSM 17038 TaxID=1121424 RepID=A0A1I2XF14_9FIRM|nr:NHLP leader peptide family RiPP precursor [Desulfotruncus arcticus]SFH12078.1 NHLP leader peptide domain-containing protein [Desulfotomaculum arcticum] [Desulfotruncus arcticus DSM 17038]